MAVQFAMAKSGFRRGSASAIAALAAIAALIGPIGEAGAKQVRQSRPVIPADVTAPREAGEPIMAIVSIKSQQVTFYDAEGWIARAPVSTGTKGRETPAGIFAVLEKDEVHHSSLYDDASMPHMQRLTWNGIAFHGGPLPGYAASHGCVRMPFGFADKMFDKTRLGMRVVVSPDDAAPAEFSHPALFVPNEAAVAAAPERAETLAREALEADKAAVETSKAAVTAARAAASLTASLRKLESIKTKADAELARANKALEAAKTSQAQAQNRAQALQLKATVAVAQAGAQLEIVNADVFAKLHAATGAEDDAVAHTTGKVDEADTARVAASLNASLRKSVGLKAKADAGLARADKALEAAKTDQAPARAQDLQLKATAEVAEAGAKLDSAKAEAKSKLHAADAAKNAAKSAASRKADTAKAASEAKLALEPVSVYISRATQKLYVRRNTHKAWVDGGVVFDASIEAPLTIRDPDRPIGTHIFTAMAHKDGGGLRWTAVSIESGDGAKDALDRITIPKEVFHLIGPTALPRSSIIVSDEPLSKETNFRTEFVAVLSDQPQGGFITRKPTPRPRTDMQVASGTFWDIFGQASPSPKARKKGRRRGNEPAQSTWQW